MNLPDIKQLDKVIALCRKRGVKTIKIDNIELTLSDELPTRPSKKADTSSDTGYTSDTPSEEELMFWSVGTPTVEA